MTGDAGDAEWRHAQALMAAGEPQAARGVLERLLQRSPRHAPAHMTLSHIAWADGRVRDAARHAVDAAQDVPADPLAIIAVARALVRVGEVVAARACLAHPVLAHTDVAQAVLYHAGVRRDLGEDMVALALLDRAHAFGVDSPDFRFARGLERLICGRARDAEDDFEASLRMDPAAAAATLELARLHTQTPQRNHLDDFNRRRALVARGSQDQAALEFACYKELEDLGHYDEAWDALARANAMMRALHPYDREAARGQVDGLIQAFGQAVAGSSERDDGPQPVFILGLPRSGTTLLDRLLGSHSQVASVGELEDFPRQLCWSADDRGVLGGRGLERLPGLDYVELGRRYLAQTRWRAGGARLFIDKQPWNCTWAALIQLALPRARLLHMVRDPMDVCFSNFRAMLGGRYAWSFDLDALASHYHDHLRLMAHWRSLVPGRILDVSYRELVENTEQTMRGVIAFCGLEWEDTCLSPSRNRTPIGTLSAVQARGPVVRSASRAWRHYERQLAGLRSALPGVQADPPGSMHDRR